MKITYAQLIKAYQETGNEHFLARLKKIGNAPKSGTGAAEALKLNLLRYELKAKGA